jgi:hypothetical protein
MKRLLSILAPAILALGSQSSALAQQYGPAATLLANSVILTNGTTSSVVSNYTAYANLARHEDFSLALQFKLVGAGNGNVVVNWATSDDGVAWANTGPGTGSITLAANGTSFVNFNTNFYLGSAGYFAITSVAGATNNATTNLSAVVWTKPKRNG